ncbi:hypothetical protein [Aeromonas taiwanensis]
MNTTYNMTPNISITLPDCSIDMHGYTVIDAHVYERNNVDTDMYIGYMAVRLREEHTQHKDMVAVVTVLFPNDRVELFSSSWIYNGTGWYYSEEQPEEWEYNMCYDHHILSRITARKQI